MPWSLLLPAARNPATDFPSPHRPSPGPAEYLLPATGRGIAVQATAALGMMTGLWVALSPLFITLQHGGTNANTADVIAGLVTAGIGAVALASPRGFPGLQLGSLLLGVWVIISSFILDAVGQEHQGRPFVRPLVGAIEQPELRLHQWPAARG